ERVADRRNRVTDLHCRRVADGDRRKIRHAVDLHQCDVVFDVVTNDVRVLGLTRTDERDLQARRVGDDVVVREVVPVGLDPQAAAGGTTGRAERGVDVDHAGVDLRGDGVEVERARAGRTATRAAVAGRTVAGAAVAGRTVAERVVAIAEGVVAVA